MTFLNDSDPGELGSVIFVTLLTLRNLSRNRRWNLADSFLATAQARRSSAKPSDISTQSLQGE